MNCNKSLEQVRQESLRIWSDAQRKSLHEAVKNTPVNPLVIAAGLGTGSGNMFENEYVDNDYLSLDYLDS
jgi:hypothetical protein